MYHVILITLLIIICLCDKFINNNQRSILFNQIPLKLAVISELSILLCYLSSFYITTIKFQFYETIAIISIFVFFYYIIGKFDFSISYFHNINFKFLMISIWTIIVLFMIIGNELNKLIDISNKTFSKKSVLLAIIIYIFTIITLCITNYYFNEDYKDKNVNTNDSITFSEKDVINSIFFIKTISIGMLLPIYILKQIDTVISHFIKFQSSFLIEKGALFVDAILSFASFVLLIYILYLCTVKFVWNNKSFHKILTKFIKYDNFYSIVNRHIR